MRIVAGEKRGHKLFPPKGKAIRPTSDRVRQSLFDILGPIHDKTILDLFAGSGALGLEALSRGATHAWFVDQSNEATELVTRNIEKLNVEPQTTLWRCDALSALSRAKREGVRFSMAFLDPPYESDILEKAMQSPLWESILETDAKVIVETKSETTIDFSSNKWKLDDNRRYGGTRISIYTLIR